MRVSLPGTTTVEYTRGKIRPALAVLVSALLATGLIGYAVARRNAAPDVQRGPGGADAPRTITLKAGDDLQRALDAARPGDTLLLDAGAAFVGPFTLPRKRGDQFINVQSSALDKLPPEGQRVSPSDAPLMPKIVSSGRGEPALRTAAAAHHYRFVGVEFTTKDEDGLVYDLLKLGGDDRTQDTLEEVPHHLVFDRCYVHAHPSQSLKRGIALNSAETSILNSYVAGFKVVGQDSQAIMGWNGPGPFHIVNNYLEGAGENLMFGGAAPSIPGLVPSDIEILHNYFSKPLAWRDQWSVKNLLELKNARRVKIDGNLFEYNWLNAQQGYAVLFTPRVQDAGAFAAVEDISFTNNVVRHAAAGLYISGEDDLSTDPRAVRGRRITVANNLFYDINDQAWGGDGAFLKIGSGVQSVTVDHNTVDQKGNITKAYGDPVPNFIFTNNIFPHSAYGIFGDGQSPGFKTLDTYFPGYVFKRNVLAGDSVYVTYNDKFYPPDNFFPPSLDSVRFVDRAGGVYRLAPSSPYKGRATDGKDLGCDFAALEAAAGSLPATRPRTVSTPR